MPIDYDKAIHVRGWMEVPELIWLGEQAQNYSSIVEVGSFAGRSTRMIADHMAGTLLCIDDFLGAESDRPLSQEQSIALYSEFITNLQDKILEHKVSVAHPQDVYEGYVGEKIKPDMVFIDGDHSYEGVKKDIKFWSTRLKVGGLLCGHDSGYPPIQQALKELIPDVKYAPQTSIWFTYKQ